MVKQLVSSEKSTVQIQDSNPGCMWGLLHILDYHHWHVKKVFTHKRRRHARYKRSSILHNQGEDQQYEVSEAEPLPVRQYGQKMSATSKSNPKNHKKGPDTENRLKEENSKGRILSLPGVSQHLDTGKNQGSSEYALHPEKDHKTTEAAVNRKRMETRSNKLDRDFTSKLKKHTDVFELFRVEKDLLFKFLRELDVSGKNLHQDSRIKARLTKSGSFPLTSSSYIRSISPSTLKHKQNEVWAFPKGEKLVHGTQATKISATSFVKGSSHEKPMPLASDIGEHSAMKQKPEISSRPSHGLNQKGWNQLVLHRFKVIKQKIKHALVEFKKSGYQTSVEATLHRASLEYSITNNEKVVSQSLDDGVNQEYIKSKSSNETKASVYASNRHDPRLIRRTSSLNESLDKYTQLFEKSFSTDVKWRSSKSKSLKLTNEDKVNKSVNAPKFSRSNFSLPNIESLSFILHEALLDMNDTTNVGETDNHVRRTSVSVPLKKDKSIGHVEETEITETVEDGDRDMNPSHLSDQPVEKSDEVVTSEQREEIHEHEQAVGDRNFPQEEEETSMSIYPIKEARASLETNREDNTTIHAEGIDLDVQVSSMDKLKSEIPNTGSVYSLPASLPNTNSGVTSEDTNKSLESHVQLLKSDTCNDSNFQYVKAILQFSGFMENDHIQMQHTIDQPLKPSLLMDLEASLLHEIKSSGEENVKIYDHQLLFNLVNEVLLEIYERSPTYFPGPFSFNYRLHPMPKGKYLLDEAWASVNSYLSLRPELDQTLDDVVGRDLARRSSWMNLQQEEERVALQLEEMIVEDLLDEIIFS